MLIEVRRKYYTLESTVSEVWVGGEQYGYFLEDRVRAASAPKVFGETAIPAGRYRVIVNWSAHFRQQMPLLLDVPGYEGVRIHPGNQPADTLGCLLCGTSYDPERPNWVSSSRDMYQRLFLAIRTALERNQGCWVEIQDTQAPLPDPKPAKAKK